MAALPDAGAACPPQSATSTGGRRRRRPPDDRLGVGLARKKHQRLRRYVTFTVTCSEACALSANGALRIYEGPAPSAVCTAHDSRPGCPSDFQRASLPTGYAGTPVELHLKLKRGVYRRARAARRAGDRVKALLSVTATDETGATTVRKFGIALR